MAKLGSEKRPIVVGVHTNEKVRYVAETGAKHGWHYAPPDPYSAGRPIC